MLLIAFDTATPAVTVALHDGERVLAEESAVDARRHGELLAASISSVLAAAGAVAADLTGIAVGVGPGPYTGLRAGLVTARVLGSALGVPVHGACTLDVIARAVVGLAADGGAGASEAVAAGHDFIVATDARRKEIYWARYTATARRVRGPEVSAPGEAGADCPVAGQGALLYPAELGAPIEPSYPSAAWLAILTAERIARGEPALPAKPLYLRRPDARIPGPPKRVTPS